MVEGRGKEASGMGWEMMPMPSLLAEPSQPRARRRRFLGGASVGEGDIFCGRFLWLWWFCMLRRESLFDNDE